MHTMNDHERAMRARTCARAAAPAAVAAPLPAPRGAVRGAFLAGLAGLVALLLAAAPPAAAQDFSATTVTISGPATVTETDANRTVTYTITRTGAEFTQTASSIISFTDADSVDSAKAGTASRLSVQPSVFTATPADYSIAGSNIVSFAPGEDSKQFSVTIVGDDLAEEDESFAIGVLFSNIGDTFLVTIIDDDAARTLTVTGPATIDEDGDTGVESGQYTVTLTGTAFTAATDVTWTVAHGTTADADFAAAPGRSGTVSFGPSDGNGSTKNFTLNIANDNLNEAGETFTVQASVADADADGGTAFGTAASTTITDDDPIAVTVTASEGTLEGTEVSCAASTTTTATVTEGNYACLNVSLSAIPTRAFRLSYGSNLNGAASLTASTDDVDATHTGGANDDLGILSNSSRINIAANTDPPVGSLTFMVTDDALNEAVTM